MRILAIAVVLLLAFGCLAQETNTTQTIADTTGSGSGSAIDEWPYVNTSGLYFERNVSDVMNTNTTFPEVVDVEFNFSNVTTPDGRLIVYYFHSSGCSACKVLRPEIDSLEADYPEVLWLEYDLANASGGEAYRDFAAQHNLSNQQMFVPQALVNDTILTDRFNINKTLEGIIKAYENSSQG
ncbi:thioredoxin family protein [Candidatus Micrarchaeota archaeon]|nr:thioredoxin family protein [Candidatus Micrarchaeota archaeon]